MKPPILVATRSDEILVYESASEAERSLEPIDVQAGEYAAYDREGRLLRMVVVDPPIVRRHLFGLISSNSYGRWMLRDGEAQPAHQEELSEALGAFLTALGEPDEWVRSATLGELVRRAVERCRSVG